MFTGWMMIMAGICIIAMACLDSQGGNDADV